MDGYLRGYGWSSYPTHQILRALQKYRDDHLKPPARLELGLEQWAQLQDELGIGGGVPLPPERIFGLDIHVLPYRSWLMVW